MTRMRTLQCVFLGLCDNGWNLISYLAKEGHDEAVQKVMALGGKIEDAIYGYAFAGNDSQVQAFCAQCQDGQKQQAIGSAVRGYARAGKFQQIHAIRNYAEYKPEILLGAAQAGDANKVKGILSRNLKLFSQAVVGYADCNHQDLLMKLIQGKSFHPLAINCAARSGHVDLVNQLLRQCGVSIHRTVRLSLSNSATIEINAREIDAYSLMNHALKGYIAGCHFKEALAMIDRGASISQGLAALKYSDDIYGLEVLMALLAHSHNDVISPFLLEQMQLQSQVSPALKITSADLDKIKQIKALMEASPLNYIEAKNLVEGDHPHTPTEDNLTLDYLGEIVHQELALESVSKTARPNSV